ncbi:MAG: 4Fe-4S binding protein [Candidatus Hodarchaeales archaeon]|jgi:epoxyqueuosine reductase QueG
MQRDKELTREIIEYSKKKRIDIIGFADPSHFKHYESRHQPFYFFDDTKTVIIIGIALRDIILDAWYQIPTSPASGYQFADAILKNICYGLIKEIDKRGFNSVVLPYGTHLPDSPGIFLKEAAALAGIGPIGKNNLLLTQKYGSQVRLRGVATDAPLVCGEPIRDSKYCENCESCIKACPVNALRGERYLKARCLPYQLSILRYISDNTTIWCQSCIESCPLYDEGKWRILGDEREN